jgi:hypothetical protein
MRLAGSRGRYPYHRGRHLKVLVDLFVYADETWTRAHEGGVTVYGDRERVFRARGPVARDRSVWAKASRLVMLI